MVYQTQVKEKAGATAFLQALRRQGVSLYLATATDRTVITQGLDRTGLLPLLDGLVTCGDLGVDKNTPAIFDYARDQMGTKTQETWVFEDAVHAVRTAKAAGFRVCAIYDPSAEEEQTEIQTLADVYIRSFEELFEANSLF